MPSPGPDHRSDEGRHRVRAWSGDRPLIDMKAVEKVEAHIADALKKGGEVVTDGKRAAHQT